MEGIPVSTLTTNDFMKMGFAQACMKAADIAYKLEQSRAEIEALVAELAKENEPFCFVYPEIADSFIKVSCGTAYRKRSSPAQIVLYTLPPTAEQIEQETAEAIAKMLDDKDVERTDYCMHVYEEGEQYKSEAIAAVRNGAWKEYK